VDLTTTSSKGPVVCVPVKGKGKAVPLQACSGPEGSRKLRFPDSQGGDNIKSDIKEKG